MKYRLRSVFRSIQGEGRNTGRPATFIRFAGCNLNCPWCDTQTVSYTHLTLRHAEDRHEDAFALRADVGGPAFRQQDGDRDRRRTDDRARPRRCA